MNRRKNSLFRKLVAGLLAFVSLAVTAPVWAIISLVTVSPATQSVPLGGSATLSLAWSVTTNASGFVTSANGSFCTDPTCAVVLGTVPSQLSRTATAPIGFSTTITLFEPLTVPTDVIYRAYRLGLTGFSYVRTFVDAGAATATQVATISITSSVAAGFVVNAMSLSFDNDAVMRVLARNERLFARAEIGANGSGLLQGVWEIADPASTSGQPVFRPLTLVRQPIAGSDKQILQSPNLPTDMSGLYMVRLRVTDPPPGFEQPVLRYFVSSGKAGEILPVVPIRLRSPARHELVVRDTQFAWENVQGARVYQVEFYARPPRPGDGLPNLGGDIQDPAPTLPGTSPTTGVLLNAAKTQTALSIATLAHLQSGRIYLWRVLAIDAYGRVIGESAVREIKVP